MSKFLKPRELIATGIQLMIFALLIPAVGVIFRLLNMAAPEAMEKFMSGVISILPFSDTVQHILSGYDIAVSDVSVMNYFNVVMTTIGEDVVTFMYLGLWLNAFKLLFKELIGVVRGLPVLQVFCGLFMGALTYPMLENEATAMSATVFLTVLNIVLIILVFKSVWKRILEIFLGLGMQSITAALSIGYFTAVLSCFTNTYPSPEIAISAVVLTTCCIMIWLMIQYLVFEK